MLENIKQSVSEAIQESFSSMFYNLFNWLARGVIDNSYEICLTVAIISLIIYIAGKRKAGKYVTISLAVYFILQSLRGFVK
ncbi:hypothetical protein FDA09_10380 [Clostridium botulinum]|uniref:hypothetical protein n=1 Tax=Clostridium botulinum TaxID=1491 RepID=UPI0007731150|nr:hypothetical protein [Clostridium botulinum]NFH80313.1 hypothetical protein [Clostridium botulinum]NFH83722.1 hypothetical protein [Clostridium botulinum]NFI11795.1 hypothetical protein [Clostridium botulinum]NFI16231.1 hypothetical protein [Clostridium botulinum]NFO84252.1 hypothetical protein [Clostridium botulinum]